ncbi:penicillin-binding protein [Isoptericola sp. b441]|uniref:Penicillin-binding protein n=1 Tax=Actinotalea lenta TaxID=3064654 RepID=A0ABT9D6I5_9CELL|nr:MULTISPECIES: penicillin-binding protein [unclassified Isoptericola]MDO8106426.1 penicillin-binding protein [Isoptericola sp. b441]MDO8121858.1 penicillin-binding protein [Isoptericola sp. b490]
MPSRRPASARQVNALQAVGLLLAFLLVATVGGVLSAGLFMPAVASTSALTKTSVGMFDNLPDELALPKLSQKSFIYAADGTLLATFYSQNRIVVPLADIALPMQHAVIDVEDRRFYDHGAVDLAGMARALVKNQLTDSNQGASTLTQQYVKNMLIQAANQIDDPVARAKAINDARDATGVEGYARKLREAKLAVTLEKKLSKDDILQGYLNIAQFGASVYGVEAAARHYFGVPAKDLDYLQAATIAGITRSPILYDPERNPKKSQERRNVVLAAMLREKDITQQQYDQGRATPIEKTLNIGKDRQGCVTADDSVPGSAYFCDYVTKIIAQDPVFGDTKAKRNNLLYTGGLSITTTLDPTMQGLADAAVKGAVPPEDPSGVGVAMSVVEPGTGKIKAMAQNRAFDPSPEPPAGHTAVNYNTDQAYGGSSGFPPGSTFKPFTLLEWFKEGHSLQEVVAGSPRTYPMSDFHASCTGFGGKPWKLGNAERSPAYMTVQDATKNSVNNAFADMATKLDLCKVFQGAEELGVHKGDGGKLGIYPSNVIGTDSVAPLTMAAAFAAFSADGTFCSPIAIESVKDRTGKSLPVPDAGCHQAISPELAHAMAYGLSKVWSGTARNVQPLPDRRPASGKTGTTSANEDTWFVGFTRQLCSAVWVGYPNSFTPMHDVTINGVFRRYVYGSTIAAPAWRAFMAPASQGMPVEQFPAPPSSMVYGVQVTVPRILGMSPDAATKTLEAAGFHVKVDAATIYSSYPAGTVAAASPGPGARVTRGSVVTLTVSQGAAPPPPPPPSPSPSPTPTDKPGHGGGKDQTPPPGQTTGG